MKFTFAAAILIFVNLAVAQEIPTSDPIVRPRDAEESSSFIGDPDQLDPLPVNRENLKEDEEPVLEDIRQVLNSPAIKTKPKATKQSDIATPGQLSSSGESTTKQNSEAPQKASTEKSVADQQTSAKKQARTKKQGNTRKQKTAKKQVRVAKKAMPQVVQSEDLNNDDPDINLERKFNQIYNRFNAEPTSPEMWESVTAGRAANTYTVQKGDTLWSVSQTLFGDPTFWPKIWSLNRARIENPHFIYPGNQVLFYAGTESDAPALAVSKDDGTPQGADSDGVFRPGKLRIIEDDDGKSGKSKFRSVGQIPDSLPVYRNDSYFLPPQLLTVDLKKLPVFPDNFNSDILLTDVEIKSEAELTKEELGKGRCGGDHLLRVSLKSTEGELGIYEPLETLKTDAGKIYSYRQVGTATVLSAERIRIKACTSVLSKDLVFVSPSDVNGLRSTKASQQPIATLIGGPGIGTQKIFSSKQLAYINLGSQNTEIGQTLNIKSQLTEKASGTVRIIDKFGSFGIGLITDVYDLVEIGDELLTQ